MSYSYERVERKHAVGGRSYLGYWMPLVLTATIATVGVAMWMWSEREDGDEDSDREEPREGGREGAPPPTYGDLGRGETSFTSGAAAAARGAQDATSGVVARMSGAIRRTPSPQQILDGASKTVAAGVAAAGAAVGGALSSIREEGRDDYVDHSRWSEEAEGRRQAGVAPAGPETRRRGEPSGASGPAGASSATAISGGQYKGAVKRKTVAIVVSSESDASGHGQDDSLHHGEASILSHLPKHVNHDTMRLFVLIYAPDLKLQQLASSASTNPTGSLTSSFSHIAHDEAQTPGEEGDRPLAFVDPTPIHSPESGSNTPRTAVPVPSGSPVFNSLYAEAQALVEKDTMILPFTTSSGHVHLLRHLAPDVVYMQESLSGDDGDVVAHISGWVGEIVVVVGAEGGHGGLVDSEDDVAQTEAEGELWWHKEERVGLGRGVEVVEGVRVGEHWGRKLGGLE